MNNTDLNTLDTETLMQLYDQALEAYKTSLLGGTPWEGVQEKRFVVSTLSIALYERLQSSTAHPAENPNRTS